MISCQNKGNSNILYIIKMLIQVHLEIESTKIKRMSGWVTQLWTLARYTEATINPVPFISETLFMLGWTCQSDFLCYLGCFLSVSFLCHQPIQFGEIPRNFQYWEGRWVKLPTMRGGTNTFAWQNLPTLT